MDKCPNEHPTAILVGHVSEEVAESYVEICPAGKKLQISAYDYQGIEKVVFNGIIDDIAISEENNVFTLTVKLIGNSALMDIRKPIRTFQSSRMSYDDVFNVLKSDNNVFAFIIPNNSSKEIQSMLVQYNESNWEFSKRIASRLGTMVIPDYTLDNPYISIGMPKLSGVSEISVISYRIHKNTKKYLDSLFYHI